MQKNLINNILIIVIHLKLLLYTSFPWNYAHPANVPLGWFDSLNLLSPEVRRVFYSMSSPPWSVHWEGYDVHASEITSSSVMVSTWGYFYTFLNKVSFQVKFEICSVAFLSPVKHAGLHRLGLSYLCHMQRS